MHGDSNNAKVKKKTVSNCGIINIKIKSLLYSLEYTEAYGGPIFATLRLGIEQHSWMIYDWHQAI